jgi:hypothetical protein
MSILEQNDFNSNINHIYISSVISVIDNNRTNDNCIIGELDCHINTNTFNNQPVQENISRNAIIYRFKFIDEFMEDLYRFSKIHQYDSRQDFKEAWKIWAEDNSDIIESETNRITRLGYDGDVSDKMFKSARYYFRKKSSEKKEPQQRRQYINISRDILNAMDLHIKSNISNADYQPKTAFVSFCNNNVLLLKDAIKKIYEQGITNSQMIQEKIKKTYKNRYFMLTNN